MAVRKTLKSNSKIKDATSNIGKAILNTPIQTMANRIMYVVLLGAFLIIGYLFGKVEVLQEDNQKLEVAGVQSTASTNTMPPAQPSPPDPDVVLSTLEMGHLPPEGDQNAPVTIVEFSDFECPFCANYFKETLPKIREEYVATGKVKIYYRHLPLSFHPQANPLALASECANDQGRFWDMHDKIFGASDVISTTTVEDHKVWAQELGLDSAQFNNCVDNATHQDLIDEDIAAAAEVDATGTPTFYINGHQLIGAQPFASFKAIIDQELSE